MGTWESLHKQHVEVFTKINLLEKALLDLLQKHTTGYTKEAGSLQEEFLEAFEHGMILHFTVEEEALFPILGKTGKKSEASVSELLAEHRSIMEKHSKITWTASIEKNRDEVFSELIHELAKHARKEEETIPPMINQLTPEQLDSIDENAKRLGYNLQ